jgi:hypothetical protein
MHTGMTATWHHAPVLAHHLLHLVGPHGVMTGLHHLLMIRSDRMLVGHGLGEPDAR